MAELARNVSDPRRRQRRNPWLIVGGVLAAIAGLLALAARDAFDVPAEVAAPVTKPQAEFEQPKQVHVESEAELIDDDGKTMWVSPTDGPPLDLAYLPPGVEIILALRPAKLLADPKGEKVVAALGPRGASAIESCEQMIGAKLRDVERVLIGWQIALDGSSVATMVVTTASPIRPSVETYQPDAGQGRITVIGPPAVIADIRSLAGQTPPLARDMERLLDHTDATRDVTLLVRPRSLLNDGNNLLDHELAPLREPIETLLDDNVAAAGVSMDWGDDFFIELIAVPTLDSSPAELSKKLAARVNELPNAVEDYILTLNTSNYSRRVVARLPEMVRRLAAYTRHGFDKDSAILRCYLPPAAGHNLLMAAELALAEGQGGSQPVAASPSSVPRLPVSIEERLQRKTSLRFAREELEAALNMLGEDVGVEIVIRGPDLQLDGITRNQLFAIDLADRRAEEILVEILCRANPDKLAVGPADPRQKLVYTVGPDAIFITTRSQATARGETLPAAFRAE